MVMGIDGSATAVTNDWIHSVRIALAIVVFGSTAVARADSSWVIEPRLILTETYSDNMALLTAAPEGGWISSLAPGIRIDGKGPRFDAFLDYRREHIFYEGFPEWKRKQNQLDSYGTLEAVEDWFFVDASANIVQRNITVFGPVSVDGLSANDNQVETRTFQIAPYVRGRVGSSADYLVRINAVDSRSDDPTLADTRVDQVVASINNRATSGTLGWFVDGSGTKVENDVIGEHDNTRFRAGLVFPLGSQIHLSASAGRETTNYASLERESTSTPGVGIEWSPSRHTQFAALREKRFFGYGHNVQFTHRTARTAWRYTDSKDASVLPTLLAGYDPGSVNTLMSDLLEASIADPEERKRAVRARMELIGAGSDLLGTGGVQTSRIYLERERSGSVAWLGVRSVFTLALTQRDQELMPFSPLASDSFDEAGGSPIRERGTSLTWLYRLTPLMTLNVALLRLRTEGLDAGTPFSTQNTQATELNIRLAPKAVASIALRRSRFEHSVTGSVDENAVTGSLTQRF